MLKINTAKEVQVSKYIRLEVILKKYPPFELTFKTINGKVEGNYKNGMSTSYLHYFNDTSDKTRKQHFEFFKDYIEKTFN